MSGRWAFIVTRLKVVLTYRTDIVFWMSGVAMQLVLFAALWRAVYSGRSEVDGVSLSAMTTYVSLSTMHTLLLHDDAAEWLSDRIREGVIGMDMARPISLLEQLVLGQVSQALMKFPLIALIFPVAVLASGMQAPAPGATGPYVVSVVLAWLIGCCMTLLVGSVAFWTLEMGGMKFLYYTIGGFLSGALVPLWFMPDWLRGALEWLPWQAMVYTPVSVYLGRTSGSGSWQAIGVQAGWLTLLGAVTVLVWRRAVDRVVVQGG